MIVLYLKFDATKSFLREYLDFFFKARETQWSTFFILDINWDFPVELFQWSTLDIVLTI